MEQNYRKKEIDPIRSHHLFLDHYGGVEFNVHVNNIQSKWSILFIREKICLMS